MFQFFSSLLSSFRVWFSGNAKAQLEIVALRHQLAVMHRQHSKPKLTVADRCFWVWLSRTWDGWRSTSLIVKPETVIDWHRGFPLVLVLEGSPRKSRTTGRSKGHTRTDPNHESR